MCVYTVYIYYVLIKDTHIQYLENIRCIYIYIYIYIYIQWGKKVFSQPPIVQVLPLKKMREACNFHHRYTSTMRDKIRKSRKSHCRIFKEFICKLWWKISIWSITKFHLNTLLYTLCWQWQRSNVFCKSSQVFTHCCWYFGPFLHAELL